MTLKPKLRFSLLSLLAMIAFTSLLFGFWNQRALSIRQQELEARIAVLENENRIYSRIQGLYSHLNFDYESDLETFQLVQKFVPFAFADMRYEDGDVIHITAISQPRLIDVDGKPGGLEILSLSNDIHFSPGSDYSINVLFNDADVVDVLVRHTGIGAETHNVEFLDFNNDSNMDLEISCSPGLFRSSEAPNTLRYTATPQGFVLTTMDD